MSLRDVPDDEADEVRELLLREGLRFYEQSPGALGLSAGGFWLLDAADYPRARALLDDYQRQRAERARAEWARARAEGRAPGLRQAFAERPAAMLLALLGIGGVLLVLLWLPWALLGR